MNTLEVAIHRTTFTDTFTLGQMTVDGMHFGYTCEDVDRHLESGGVKIPKQTAIPRGRYRLTATYSDRFKKLMLLIENVKGFSGIRIHGGNTHANTDGCPLLGRVPTSDGVANCGERNATLLDMVVEAEEEGRECWIEVS